MTDAAHETNPRPAGAALMQIVAAGCASMSLVEDPDEDRAVATLRAAREAGIRLFDTARAYATADDPTHNESLLRRAFGITPDVLIMTKGGHFRTGRRTWDVDNSPPACAVTSTTACGR